MTKFTKKTCTLISAHICYRWFRKSDHGRNKEKRNNDKGISTARPCSGMAK